MGGVEAGAIWSLATHRNGRVERVQPDPRQRQEVGAAPTGAQAFVHRALQLRLRLRLRWLLLLLLLLLLLSLLLRARL